MIPLLCGIIKNLAGSSVLELSYHICVRAGRLADVQVACHLHDAQILVRIYNCLLFFLFLRGLFLLFGHCFLHSLSLCI